MRMASPYGSNRGSSRGYAGRSMTPSETILRERATQRHQLRCLEEQGRKDLEKQEEGKRIALQLWCHKRSRARFLLDPGSRITPRSSCLAGDCALSFEHREGDVNTLSHPHDVQQPGCASALLYDPATSLDKVQQGNPELGAANSVVPLPLTGSPGGSVFTSNQLRWPSLSHADLAARRETSFECSHDVAPGEVRTSDTVRRRRSVSSLATTFTGDVQATTAVVVSEPHLLLPTASETRSCVREVGMGVYNKGLPHTKDHCLRFTSTPQHHVNMEETHWQFFTLLRRAEIDHMEQLRASRAREVQLTTELETARRSLEMEQTLRHKTEEELTAFLDTYLRGKGAHPSVSSSDAFWDKMKERETHARARIRRNCAQQHQEELHTEQEKRRAAEKSAHRAERIARSAEQKTFDAEKLVQEQNTQLRQLEGYVLDQRSVAEELYLFIRRLEDQLQVTTRVEANNHQRTQVAEQESAEELYQYQVLLGSQRTLEKELEGWHSSQGKHIMACDISLACTQDRSQWEEQREELRRLEQAVMKRTLKIQAQLSERTQEVAALERRCADLQCICERMKREAVLQRAKWEMKDTEHATRCQSYQNQLSALQLELRSMEHKVEQTAAVTLCNSAQPAIHVECNNQEKGVVERRLATECADLRRELEQVRALLQREKQQHLYDKLSMSERIATAGKNGSTCTVVSAYADPRRSDERLRMRPNCAITEDTHSVGAPESVQMYCDSILNGLRPERSEPLTEVGSGHGGPNSWRPLGAVSGGQSDDLDCRLPETQGFIMSHNHRHHISGGALPNFMRQVNSPPLPRRSSLMSSDAGWPRNSQKPSMGSADSEKLLVANSKTPSVARLPQHITPKEERIVLESEAYWSSPGENTASIFGTPGY